VSSDSWLYQNPLETKEDFQGPVTSQKLVRLMIDGPLSDTTWVKRAQDGKTGFAGSFEEVGDGLLRTIDALVPRWVGRRGKPPRWAHGWFQSVAEELPGVAWPVVLALLVRARSDEDLAWIAAGTLETLLAHHGALVMGRLEQEARGNENLRKALTMVWRSSVPDGVWRHIEALLALPQ
jgi:hypothetical protein